MPVTPSCSLGIPKHDIAQRVTSGYCEAFWTDVTAGSENLAKLPRTLKVFRAQFGFHDTVVATSSQTAALRAWGTRQNLFADGSAQLATDQSAIDAALKYPEQPLRRAVGTNEPFSLAPVALPTVPDLPRQPQQVAKARSPRPAPADRSKLDSAETLIRKLETERKQEEAELRREEDALAQRRTSAQEVYVKVRKKANDAVEAALRDYRKAGGTD